MKGILDPLDCPFCGIRIDHPDPELATHKATCFFTVASNVAGREQKYHAWNRRAASDSHVIPPPRGTGSQQGASAAVLDALRDGIPLQEPVNITKAVLAQREARVSLSGGTGPVACAMLVNIQLTGWAEGPEKAEAFASGYNTAMKWYRDALLDLAERVSADAATRCRVEGGNTSENMVVDKAAKNDSKTAETRMDSSFDGAGEISAPAAGTDKDANCTHPFRTGDVWELAQGGGHCSTCGKKI